MHGGVTFHWQTAERLPVGESVVRPLRQETPWCGVSLGFRREPGPE